MLDQSTLDLIRHARDTQVNWAFARRLIGVLDLTSLNKDDTPETVDALCRWAVTPHGHVAAVCILPGFVAQAKAALAGTGVKVATLVDFPEGVGTPEDVLRQTQAAVTDGADEIDIVFPYRRFLSESPPPASKNIRAVREAGGYDIRVKAIMEVGAYPNPDTLLHAAKVAIDGGADFLATATGAKEIGATLEGAAILLSEIRASGLPVGFKASGWITDPAAAASYLTLAEAILGDGWATPDNFRIGASKLLPALLELA